MVRRFNLADVLLMNRLQRQGVYLDLETAVLWAPAPLWVALVDYFSLNEGRSCTLILSESSVQGFVQAWDRSNRLASDVICIAPSLRGSRGTPELWHKLLERLCADKGEQGVQRVFARPSDDAQELDVFRHLGFATYARQLVFRLDRLPGDLDPEEAPLFRSLDGADTWALQRLRSSLIPRAVQQAEGGVGQERDLAGLSPWWRPHQVKEYVWANGDQIEAYLRTVVGGEGHWLRMMLGPQAQGEADRLLSEALRMVSVYPPRPVYCSVRGYEGGLQGALMGLGFQAQTSELLMVKQTTVRPGVKVSKLSPALEKQVETATPISTPIVGEQ